MVQYSSRKNDLMHIVLLALIFIRPFISALAFPYLNLVYTYTLIFFLGAYIFRFGIDRLKTKPLKFALIVFGATLIISVLFSQDRLNSVRELYKYITGILLLIVFASTSKEIRSRTINIVIFAGFIISLLAIYQYFFGFANVLGYLRQSNINFSFALDYLERQRVFLPFVTADILGGYLVMMLMLVLIDKKYSGFVLPLFFALLLTKSLGALLCLFFGLVVYFYLQNQNNKKKTVLFLAVSALAVVSVYLFRQRTSPEHAQPIFSIFSRINYWQEALSVIKAHPIFGVGLGNFNLVNSRYAHNFYLQIWAEAGVLAVIGFLAIVFIIIKIGYAKIKQAQASAICRGLLLALVVVLLHNFIDFTFFLPEVAFLWWVIAGLIISV